MNDSDTDYIDEAARLIEIIDLDELSEKEMLFVSSIRSRVIRNNFISQKQIFWLRDIKDKQLR